MINRTLLFCALAGILCIFSCISHNERNSPEVALFSEESGLQTSLHMIFDPDNTGILCAKPSEIVTLKKPGSSINPYTAFSSSGDFYVMTGDTFMIEYGSYHYEYVISDSIQRSVAVFRRIGLGEKALGAVSGKIFTVDTTGKSTQIGECAYMIIKTPEGEERTVYASRLSVTSSKWQIALGEKIFNINAYGLLEQAGWVEWREITAPDGQKLVILMTKGMHPESKWSGRYNGVLYKDI